MTEVSRLDFEASGFCQKTVELSDLIRVTLPEAPT